MAAAEAASAASSSVRLVPWRIRHDTTTQPLSGIQKMQIFSVHISRRQQLYVLCALALAVYTAFQGLSPGHSLLVAGILLYAIYLTYCPAPQLGSTLPEMYRWYRSCSGRQVVLMKYVMYLAGVLIITGMVVSFVHFVRAFPWG